MILLRWFNTGGSVFAGGSVGWVTEWCAESLRLLLSASTARIEWARVDDVGHRLDFTAGTHFFLQAPW